MHMVEPHHNCSKGCGGGGVMGIGRCTIVGKSIIQNEDNVTEARKL